MPEEMDLNWLRGTGLQPGESELPQDDDGGEEDKGILFLKMSVIQRTVRRVEFSRAEMGV